MRIQDRFTLLEVVGIGGMSQVWRANDEVLGRPVAVKVLTAPATADWAATWREARAAAKLTHPCITQVYDYGEVPQPCGTSVPYLVMELVEGENLALRLAAGALPWPEAVRLGSQVAAALAAAHRLGVVHRDVKPGNVMLTSAGAKVLDFGIAAVAGEGAAGELLIGTPTYAAPERLDPGPAQPAGDVFSFGVLLYETLTGHPPVSLATWADAAAAHRTGWRPAPLSVPGLPDQVAALCLACLSPDPAARPGAEQVSRELARVVGAPDLTAALPTGSGVPTVAVPRRFAVGSAPLPYPPTMIDGAMGGRPAAAGRRWLLPASVAGVVALIGVLLLVASLWPGGSGGRQADGGTAGAVTAAPEPSESEAALAPREQPVRTDQPDPRDVVTALELAITDALATGAIDGDGAKDLRAKLDDTRKQLIVAKPTERAEKVRDKAEDLLEKIDDLREDGEIDPATADHLVSLLQPLLHLGRG
jgi:serine/threonine-protein kinase